jgi:putative tryptophan/tyrosine transport system substrate-binding protein
LSPLRLAELKFPLRRALISHSDTAILPGRREFLAGVASAVMLRPFSAVAGQMQPCRLGVLVGLAPSEDTPIAQAFIKPFRESMRSVGCMEGGNIQIEYRFGSSLADQSKTRASGADLIAFKPDVIYCQSYLQLSPFAN